MPHTKRSRTLAVTGLAVAATTAAALAAGTSAAESQAQPTANADGIRADRIVGTVGPGFVISVTPRRVVAGTHRLVVHDMSSMHNWHISGPGVHEKTGIAFQGTRRFRVRLNPGRYRVQCDAHPTTMVTHLRVHR